MARVDHRGALAVEALDAVEDGVAALGVHGHGGLVKEEQLGAVGDAAGDVEAAQQAPRELAGAELGEVLEAHELDGLLHQGAPAAGVVDVEGAEAVDVLAHGELVEDRHALGHHADAPREVVARGRHGLAEQLDGAFVVGEQLQDAVDGRGLAAAVGSQKAKDLAPPHREVEVVQGDQVPVALHEVAHLDGGVGGGMLRRAHGGSVLRAF